MAFRVLRSQTVFTSSEISTITNNFGVVIGEGGFGKVYLGVLYDRTKVAVKIPSKSSIQGYREFLAEVISWLDLDKQTNNSSHLGVLLIANAIFE